LASELVRQLIDSGVHFGHRVSRWNPKMDPFIFGKRNLIHIIDIRETLKGLLRAKKFLSQVVGRGDDVLFVGTKRQARPSIQAAAQRCGMHYVTERWLGGTLTNFRTIRSRLARLEELEAIERSGDFAAFSKKMMSTLNRERRKISRNLSGIRNMSRLPGALVVVDVRREHIAVKEAKKLGIPTVCLIDTDSDPDFADIPIPGNDDAMRAIEIVVMQLADAVDEGRRSRPAEAVEAEGPRPPRRARHVTARSGRAAAETPEEAPAESAAASDPASAAPTTDAAPSEPPAAEPPAAEGSAGEASNESGEASGSDASGVSEDAGAEQRATS
jgi:small subunit ribosomal protein S2